MKIDRYLDSLLPSFSRQRLLDDLAVIREELKDNTLPPIKSIATAFGTRKFESQWVADFNTAFTKGVNLRFKGNFYNGMYDVLQIINDNVDAVESLINAYYADDVLRDAMTVLRINLLQYLETMSFAVRYARRIAVATMAIEVDAVSEKQGLDTVITAGEVEWLTTRRVHFFAALNTLSAERKVVEERFKALPDMTVNADSIANTNSIIGANRTDPFQFGLIPIVLNPIYHVRMAIADWQVTRYKAAQEEKRMLEFKLLKLKLAQTGKKDARLDEQIEYTAGRLDKLNYKLKTMEEQYGTA